MSEELKTTDPRREVPLPQLMRAIDAVWSAREVDGVTISGGEPLDQAEELTELLLHLRALTSDILVYTGYTMEEILSDPLRSAAAEQAGVLVTGRYVEALNDGRALRGSSNQCIEFLNQDLRRTYETVLQQDRSVQVGQGGTDVFLIGLLG